MSRFFNNASRLALIVALPALALSPVSAADFTVTGTDTASKTVSGADKGLIEEGATLETTGTAISQSGAATDVVISNRGTLESGSRGLDVTGGNGTRNVTLDNQGLIDTANDSFRVDTNVTSGTIKVDNDGAIRSQTGQVVDFASMESGSAVVDIDNSGTLEALDSDVMRFGGGTISVSNSGQILSTQSASRGIDMDEEGEIALFEFYNSEDGVISAFDDTIRISDAPTVGTVIIENRGTISSVGTGGDGGQALDFAGVLSGSTIVDIDNSGTIEAFDNDAIRIGGGTVSITNSGQILSTQSANRAINIDEEGDITSFDLYNGEDGVISSIDDAIRFSDAPTVGTVVLENHGTISSIGTGDDAGQAIDFNGIRATSVRIKNYGLIETQDADAVRPGQGGVIENWGEIRGRAVDPNESSDGIDFQDFNTGEVINHDGGVITGARHGITGKVATTITNEAGALIQGYNGSGINFDTLVEDGPMTVINHGTIVGTFNPDADYGDGDGIDIDSIGHVYNYGTIRGEGSKGTKEGDLAPATSEAIAIGGGIIVNGSSKVRDALISGVDNGILVDDSETGDAFEAIEIVNWGRIEGLDGFGIRIVSSDENTIENFGTIAGSNGVAVEFGAGDDLYVHHADAAVEGYVDGGLGTDTFGLGTGTGSFDLGLLADDGTYRNFEIFEISQGNWTLSGASAIAGKSTFEDSTVVLQNADLSNSAVTLVDTILRGDGSLGGLDVVGSTVELGTSSGGAANLHVMGDVSFDARSTLALSLRGASVDTLTSDGGLEIANGATLVIGGTGSGCIVNGCTILSADEGITGEFTLDNRLVFLDADVDYLGNDAFLELTRNDTTFESVGQSRNQQSVGDALDRTGTGNPLQNEVAGMTVEQALAAFDQISGDAYASSVSNAAVQSVDFTDQLLERLHGGRPVPAPQATPSAYGPGLDSFATPAGRAWNAWAMATGNRTDIDSDGNAAGLRSTSGGIAGGVDAAFGDSVIGVAASYAATSMRSDGIDSEIDADTVRIAAYGAHRAGAFRFAGGASFGWSFYDAERDISVGAVSETASADYDGYSGSLFGEVSYDLQMQGVRIQPFGGLTVTRIQTDAFTETGAPLAGLSVGEIEETFTFSQIGMRFATTVEMESAMLVPTAKIGWRHAFDGDPVAANMQLAGAADFVVDGLPIAEDSLSIGAGLEAHLASGTSLGVNYSGDFAEDASQHTGQAFVRFAF